MDFTNALYKRYSDLILMEREKYSYEYKNNYFPHIKHILVPDIIFTLQFNKN